MSTFADKKRMHTLSILRELLVWPMQKNDDEAKLAYSVIAEARARIARYGSVEVATKMAEVFRLGPIKRADMAQHAGLIKAMRFDASRLPGNISNEAAFELLYGNAEDY